MAQRDTTLVFQNFQMQVDVVGLLQLATSDYGQIEGAVKVNLRDKWFPTVEIGLGKANTTHEATELHYQTKAPYFKAGMDWNIAKNKHDDYRIYAGFRYAFTSFSFDIDGPDIEDPIWGTSTPYGQNGLKANYHWLEGVFGVDAKIAGPLHLGWTARYRRRISHSEGDMDNCWYVPGYGTRSKTKLGGTFNVSLQF